MPPNRQGNLPKQLRHASQPLSSNVNDDQHVRKRRKIEKGFRKAIGQAVSEDEGDEDSNTDTSSSDDDVSDPKVPSAGRQNSNGDQDTHSNDDADADDDDDEEEEEEDWEVLLDVAKPTDRKLGPLKPSENIEDGDLVFTLDQSQGSSSFLKKKGVSARERQERLYTHTLHVICLLYHGHRRNVWINNEELQTIILKSVEGSGAKKNVEAYFDFIKPREPPASKRAANKRKKKGKGKGTRKTSEPASSKPLARPLPPQGGTDTKLVEILGLIMRFWKRTFHIDAPGLRKRGYCENITEAISADKENEMEKIKNIDDFRQRAKGLYGSRDTGAQLFTALLRALGFEARLVFSLCPLGYGFAKSEMRDDSLGLPEVDTAKAESSTESSECDSGSPGPGQASSKRGKEKSVRLFDKDLKYPTFWTEVYSPITERWVAIDALVTGLILSNDNDMSKFEPRGLAASKSKQQISYVIAYNADKSVRDVTIRYLSRMVFPGKTKGLRMPMFEREVFSNNGDLLMAEKFDLFSERILKCFQHPKGAKPASARDIKEDQDLQTKISIEASKLQTLEGGFPKSIAAYKNHLDYILERHLKREDCILPGELPVHTLAISKSKTDPAKEEKVYSRKSIIVGKPAENWYKEGRVIKINEQPLKQVPSRAVTVNRKREIEDAKREGDTEAGRVGLYGFYQTELYRPPPIVNGMIPKNSYGNVDCFVPSMIPKGAVHVPWRNAARMCKKLELEFAEAVTGFEFKNKRAIPRTEGVLCSEENFDVLTEACRQDEEQRKMKEDEKREQTCLALWKKFLIGLRIVERVEEDYGSGSIGPVWDAPNLERESAADSDQDGGVEEGGFFRE
ncbi:hypothetical protein TWF730_001294 [Orbilia blumenaviensis]|uniref:Rad4-domain-containing protein n=1 Tax=Orbilia blumenaviensis TaxID=1796055 RepID=A0AAV9UKW4_9PEZI